MYHAPLTSSERERLARAIHRFPQCRILVVGDLMLDTFIWGEVNRISPEAPVPVVEVREETHLLGGTANVAHNVAALGGRVSVAGVVGPDAAGRSLHRLLEDIGVPTEGLVVEDGRPTTVKTRVIAHQQQIVRFDREEKRPPHSESLKKLLAFIKSRLNVLDGIIVSDYAKGVVSSDFMDALRELTGPRDIPVMVDPKVRNAELYHSVTLITPNHHEAARMAGMDIRDEATLEAAGRHLLRTLNCRTVLITRGKDGMSLFHHDGGTAHIPTVARRVFDVTGAGDTVIAAVTLGMVAGLSAIEAAHLANLAAGIVVGEVGTAAVSSEQLLELLRQEC